MKTFKKHLQSQMKDKAFATAYNEEKELRTMALKIVDARSRSGLTQAQLAKRAKITQQQLSKVENGSNCNLTTFLRVCEALRLRFNLSMSERKAYSTAR